MQGEREEGEWEAIGGGSTATTADSLPTNSLSSSVLANDHRQSPLQTLLEQRIEYHTSHALTEEPLYEITV